MTSLREALIELDALRKRDNQVRQETELVLDVVRVLADNPDGQEMVSKILDTIVTSLGDPVAIYVKQTTDGALSFPYVKHASPPEHWAGRAFLSPKALRKPGLIFDVTKLPDWQAPMLDREVEHEDTCASGLMAPVHDHGGWAALFLLRTGDQEPFSSSEFRVFKRVLPLMKEAYIREHNHAERVRMEMELRQMQKLEALGTLAGGIAHEINTPMQYVTNNMSFLADSFVDVSRFIETLQADLPLEAAPILSTALETLDYDFLAEELPLALQQTQSGLRQITKIIQAIKEFSHPGSKVHEPHSLNNLIETALTVSRNQWKYVTDVETDFDASLPMIPCFADGLRQVVLNLIVNAVHAIEDKRNVQKPEQEQILGLIRITTRQQDGWAVMRVSDSGNGMPTDVVARIFDPFFTTKEPGRGTGQGLSICHSIVVHKHHGRIEVESVKGAGTTFEVWLPLTPPQAEASS